MYETALSLAALRGDGKKERTEQETENTGRGRKNQGKTNKFIRTR